MTVHPTDPPMFTHQAILRPRTLGQGPNFLDHSSALPPTAYKPSLDPPLANQGLRFSNTLPIKAFPLFLSPPHICLKSPLTPAQGFSSSAFFK